LSIDQSKTSEYFCQELDNAKTYAEVWKIVKKTVEYSMRKRRGSMMLFLDNLPLQLGAYYPVGTNNIVLNRALVDVVETKINSKETINALIYNLLLHEYLHALGEMSETAVRQQVIEVANKSFGETHQATVLARKSPWMLLKDLPLAALAGSSVPKGSMEIVRDFEGADRYIV
jgi:diketogulonate reductase-like aldo/keto reductase